MLPCVSGVWVPGEVLPWGTELLQPPGSLWTVHLSGEGGNTFSNTNLLYMWICKKKMNMCSLVLFLQNIFRYRTNLITNFHKVFRKKPRLYMCLQIHNSWKKIYLLLIISIFMTFSQYFTSPFCTSQQLFQNDWCSLAEIWHFLYVLHLTLKIVYNYFFLNFRISIVWKSTSIFSMVYKSI